MKQYNVTGMSCAACSARVEKAVSLVPGVTSCSVSLLTNSMGVEGDAKTSEVIKAVEDAGYGASLKTYDMGNNQKTGTEEEQLADRTTPLLKKRFFASLVFLIVLMYFSMGHMMWNWPVWDFMADNHVMMGLLMLILSAIIMVINQSFFISGFKSLFKGAPNMDTLVALGSGAAFCYSTAALFVMTYAEHNGDTALVESLMNEFYFESAGMILTLITLGKMLEAKAKGKTTDALKGLMKLAPKTAVVERDSVEVQVMIDEVRVGDIFVVRPGENIPTDGVVIEGTSAVNEASLTGESIPVDKSENDNVFAATLNQSGFLRCRATKVGQDTTLSQIIKMVSDAAATKAPIAKIADRVSGIFVPAVIVIATVTVVVWLLLGAQFGYALARGISVLVISCPCALGLATPVAIMVGNGVAAKHGIMFKNSVSLEYTGKIQIVALDKTGTITDGKPKVTDIICAGDVSENELLEVAFSLENKSEHPLAMAVTEYAAGKNVRLREITDFSAVLGNGLFGRLDGEDVYAGNYNYISSKTNIPEYFKVEAEKLSLQGKTPLYFMKCGSLTGIIAVADVIKKDSQRAIEQLKKMGIYVVMLTGDNEKTANAIGRQAGVHQVISDVMPDGKEMVIRMLKEYGRVAMVGDGINDAPALTQADIGIAIGAGTDIAIDAADIVLMKNSILDVCAAIRLSRATLINIRENLFWAFIYNIIGIPLAAGLFIPIFGWELNPMFGAAAMSLSSFSVVSNALRLNLVKPYYFKKDRKRNKAVFDDKMIEKINNEVKALKEEKNMKKTISITGMMCGHCEARVKKVLEALQQVDEAVVSYESGTAVVTLNSEISNDELKQVIEAQDYTVTEIL